MPVIGDSWNGDEIEDRAKRATGRGVLKIGEQVAVDATSFAHVISGTLRRSIHTAQPGYNGASDEEMARGGDLPNATSALEMGEDQVIEVGSWLPYACVEETGRNHKFITPAVDLAAGYAGQIMQAAFEEEGL